MPIKSSFPVRTICLIVCISTANAWADTSSHSASAALVGQVQWLAYASALEKRRDWSGLLAWGNQWTQAEPDDSTAWFVLGRAYSKVGRYPEAIAAYRRNLNIDASDVSAWINLGNLYRVGNRFSEALQAYRQALQLDPEYIQAWHNLGQTLYALKGMTGVGLALQKLNAHDPQLAQAWRQLIIEYAFSRDQRVAQKAIGVLRGLDAEQRRQMFDILLDGI